MSVNEPNPLNRSAVWSLSGSTSSEAATWYFSDSNAKTMLANSAGEAAGGYKRSVAAFSLQWSKAISSASSLTGLAQNYVNTINENVWAGGAARTWRCVSFSATPKTEIVGDEIVEYFDASAKFEYNAETHDIQVIDIGLNWAASTVNTCSEGPWTGPVPAGYFLDDNCIRSDSRYLVRFMVPDENGVNRPNPKPQPLDGNGRPANVPAILPRRVYLLRDFGSFFGSPE